MSGKRRAAALALAATTMLAAGCGSASSHAVAPAAHLSQSLNTSLAIGATTWAVVPMGAPSGANLFWQLFALPGSGSRWVLETPPDIATNGAIAVAASGGLSVVAGVRPSLDLTFSPITSTANGGRSWGAGPPAGALADVPDALAASPDGSQLIALFARGRAARADLSGTSWSTLATERSLAATAAGRACGLTALTAAAYSTAGLALLGGNCSRAGQAGVFAGSAGHWQAAGPALPGSLAGQQTQLLRLARTARGDVALLQAGTGQHADLLAAWTTGHGRWTLSPPFSLHSAQVVSTSFGSDGATGIVLTGGQAETIAGPGSSWQALPKLPSGHTVTLALPAAGQVEALAATGGRLTVWRAAPGAADWAQAQVIKVAIPYGSSS